MHHMGLTTDFYFFRHSETFRNQAGLEIQGWINDGAAQLTEKGIQGAEHLGEGLYKLVPDAAVIYTSDLDRSVHTAEIVAKYYDQKVLVFKDPRLREKCHGPWDTMSPKTRNEVSLRYYTDHAEELKAKQDRFAKWKIEPLSLGEIEPKLPDCQDKLESIYDVFARGSAVIKELGELFRGQKVLISSHGAFNDILATEAESRQKRDNDLLPVYFEPKARHFPKNCAVYHFTWDGEKLTFAGEISL
jgi:broad specificity phosphatase PhoE